MKDERLLRPPIWLGISELISGFLFAIGFIAGEKGSAPTWLALAASFFLIVAAARSLKMEVRRSGSQLRIVNTFRTIDIPLSNIESIMPDQSLSGPLRLKVRDGERPIKIEVSPPSGKRREELRFKLRQAMIDA